MTVAGQHTSSVNSEAAQTVFDTFDNQSKQSIQQYLQQLQKLQYNQTHILGRLDILNNVQKKVIESKNKKNMKDASTQTYIAQGEDIIRDLEEKYKRDMERMEHLLNGERQFREKEFAASFERQMEMLRYEVAIEANIKVRPLKQESEATKDFKEKTLGFMHGEQKIRKLYKIEGNIGKINSILNQLHIHKDDLFNNETKQKKSKVQTESIHINSQKKETPNNELSEIGSHRKKSKEVTIEEKTQDRTPIVKRTLLTSHLSSLPPLNASQLIRQKSNLFNKKRKIFSPKYRSQSQCVIDTTMDQTKTIAQPDCDNTLLIGFYNSIQSQKQKYPSQGKLLTSDQLQNYKISLKRNSMKYATLSLSQKISKANLKNDEPQQKINALQISQTLELDKGIKLKVHIKRMNENLFGLNMDRHFRQQCDVDQIQCYTRYRRIMIQFEEFMLHSFNLDDIYLEEFKFLESRKMGHQRFKETYQIMKILSSNVDKLYEIYVSYNLLQMTKITEINKMRLYNFIKLFQDVLGFQETPKFGKDHLILQFYIASRMCAKDISEFLARDSIESKIEYAKRVLSYQPVQEKYFLTFPSFLEALVRVIHAKNRHALKESERLSVLLFRFFNSSFYKENACKSVSICFKIKEQLWTKEVQEVLDHYRDSLKLLFSKLISEQLDKRADTLQFIKLLRFFTQARVFNDNVNVLKAGANLVQLQESSLQKPKEITPKLKNSSIPNQTSYSQQEKHSTPDKSSVISQKPRISMTPGSKAKLPLNQTQLRLNQKPPLDMSHKVHDLETKYKDAQISLKTMSKVFKWLKRVKQRIQDRHNLVMNGDRVQEHKFEFKEMCEIILTALDNKQLFLKDGRLETISEDDLTMTFDEFCNALLIVIHLYHDKLLLYQEFTIKETIDDYLHHLLNRFSINSNPLFRKRFEKMMKMNFQASMSRTMTPNHSEQSVPSNGQESFGQILKRLKLEKMRKEEEDKKNQRLYHVMIGNKDQQMMKSNQFTLYKHIDETRNKDATPHGLSTKISSEMQRSKSSRNPHQNQHRFNMAPDFIRRNQKDLTYDSNADWSLRFFHKTNMNFKRGEPYDDTNKSKTFNMSGCGNNQQYVNGSVNHQYFSPSFKSNTVFYGEDNSESRFSRSQKLIFRTTAPSCERSRFASPEQRMSTSGIPTRANNGNMKNYSQIQVGNNDNIKQIYENIDVQRELMAQQRDSQKNLNIFGRPNLNRTQPIYTPQSNNLNKSFNFGQDTESVQSHNYNTVNSRKSLNSQAWQKQDINAKCNQKSSQKRFHIDLSKLNQQISKSFHNSPEKINLSSQDIDTLYDQIKQRQDEKIIHKRILEEQDFDNRDSFVGHFTGDQFLKLHNQRTKMRENNKKMVIKKIQNMSNSCIQKSNLQDCDDKGKFGGQIGVSNDDRQRIRQIKLDDLKVTLEKQMKERVVMKEVSSALNMQKGQQLIEKDQINEQQIREQEKQRKLAMQDELMKHYEMTQKRKSEEGFKRDMADYLKSQIKQRRSTRDPSQGNILPQRHDESEFESPSKGVSNKRDPFQNIVVKLY